MAGEEVVELRQELKELERQAQALAGQWSSASAVEGRYRGSDPDELVSVVIDGQGLRTEVRLRRGWQRSTDGPGLGQAVVMALSAASRARLEGWAAGTTPISAVAPLKAGAGAGSGAGAGAEASPLLDEIAPTTDPLAGLSGPELMRPLLRLLDAAERELDDLPRSLEERLSREVEVASPDRTVVVRGSAVSISDVQFRSAWLTQASTEEVSYWLLRLTREAHRRMWSGSGQDLTDGLAELRSVMADPSRLLTRLGLAGLEEQEGP
jgi:hypothetical protein